MTDRPILLDGPPPDDLSPGIYTAPSDSPSFGFLRGIVLMGEAEALGEVQLEDGQRAIAVRVLANRMTPNAQSSITIGAEFFSAAKDDYSNWREKWWREALQNSVDAKASNIVCEVRHLDEQGAIIPPNLVNDARYPPKSVVVTVDDDGVGMDEEILLGKFLVLGGSGKKGTAGSLGGFGKAKELLLLPWMRWMIETQDLRVEGHGIQYDLTRVPVRRGTRLTVEMAPDDSTSAPAAIAFIKKCFLPGVRFLVNDEVVKADLKIGDLVRELVGANVYFDKKKRLSESMMLIRVGGMYMHQRWISEGIEGTIIVELTGRSIDLLTANRDSIRNYALSRELDQYVNELAADTKSATRGRKNMVREKFKGEGKFKTEAKRLEADVLYAIGDLEPKKGKLGKDQVSQILEILGEVGLKALREEDAAAAAGEYGSAEGQVVFVPPVDAVAVYAEGSFLGPRHVEVLAKQLAWEPDFYLINEDPEFRVSPKFRPDKMTPAIRKLARFWAELCRFVLIQLNHGGEYGIGWIFDRNSIAAYQLDGRENWLLLNPFVDARLDGEVYTLSNDEHINALYASAVHEATHMSDGIAHHNESFAAALTVNFAKTANKGRQIERIRKAVVARGVETGKGTAEIGEKKPKGSTRRSTDFWMIGYVPEAEALERMFPDRPWLTFRDRMIKAIEKEDLFDRNYDAKNVMYDLALHKRFSHDYRPGDFKFWYIDQPSENDPTLIYDEAHRIFVIAPYEAWRTGAPFVVG